MEKTLKELHPKWFQPVEPREWKAEQTPDSAGMNLYVAVCLGFATTDIRMEVETARFYAERFLTEMENAGAL